MLKTEFLKVSKQVSLNICKRRRTCCTVTTVLDEWCTAEPTCQQQHRLLLKQVGLEMTLEGAQCCIWYSEFSWQTVPCSWSIDGEAALTGSSPGAWDQQSPSRYGTRLLATVHGMGRHTQVSQITRGEM